MKGIRGHLAVRRGEFLLEAEFEAPSRGVTAVFGPSGCGKTTLLRCIAGLEKAATGWLTLNGETWQDRAQGLFIPAHRRSLGYVFQEASLFPHLSVRANLEYGWKRILADQRRLRFEDVIDLLAIGSLLERDPAGLSGGERQRVAIARALLTSPRLLLMDEPLSALDRASKSEILPYLERLHAELSIPVLLVSHAHDEVARLADHMILMEGGRVRASGRLEKLLVRFDLPLALSPDAEAILETRVAGHDGRDHLTELESAGGPLLVPRVSHSTGQPLRVRIHARDVSITLERPSGSSILNVLPATVVDLREAGPAQLLVRLALGGEKSVALLARITKRSGRLLDLRPGLPVYAQIKSVALLD